MTTKNQESGIKNQGQNDGKRLPKYEPLKIESKWQEKWEESGLNTFDKNSTKDKSYVLAELPYPSGDLHMGHWFTFVGADVYARLQRAMGKNVLFPLGFDAFGLPAENAAIKRNIEPKAWTLSNISAMTTQFKNMGSMIDLDRLTITCLPEYYRWNQWIFLKMFEKGIAYRSKMLSNWCPVDQTVLANEHVENGKCWRCGAVVEQKQVEQWFLKITAYADKLLWDENGNGVDWPMSVQSAQNEWIGKKDGIEITYPVKETEETVTVFTTRPDTNYGATFIALAPEHPLISKILSGEIGSDHKSEMQEYVTTAKQKSELERKEDKEKTGVFTGLYAINHLTGYSMPIWVSDFVLSNFGTGALVGVPAHDMRDFEFAQKFGLEIKRVVVGSDGDTSEITTKEQVQEEEGTMINSDFLNGMDIHAATQKIMDYIEEKGWGKRVTTYHLHDWSISRQRYWGTPVPIIHCEKDGMVAVPEDQLPVVLPENVDYMPKGKPPLASNEEWLSVTCPKCGDSAKRDAETLDTFFDSSWYYYRYLNPNNDKEVFSKEDAQALMPVDIYFGGGEHTLGHTLYARFFTKFFQDLGLVPFSEFANKRVQHGIVLGPDGNKMSKSKGNVVNPDGEVKKYGADAVRTYICFFMPYDSTGPWNSDQIWGTYKFLQRVWDLADYVSDRQEMSEQDLYHMHRAIKEVGKRIADIKFNTAIAALMEWLNSLEKKAHAADGFITKEEYEVYLKLLAPFAPHMTEEIWQSICISANDQTALSSIHKSPWPVYSEHYLKESQAQIVVQVNGKMRGVITIANDAAKDQEFVESQARADEKIAKYITGEVKSVKYILGKVLNFVIA